MQNKHIISWLRFVVFFLFLGRGWQHISFEGPYSTLFFGKKFGGIFLSLLTKSDQYSVDKYNILNNINFCIGVIFLIAAFSVLMTTKRNSYFKKIVIIGWAFLLLYSIGFFIEKKFSYAYLFEYSAQLISPYLLLKAVKYKMKSNFLFIAKLAIAVTFICHGLFAINYYPTPGFYTDMMIKTFWLSNGQAEFWLSTLGYLDFIFAIGIFIPVVSRYFLIYGVIWGFLTAFARIYTNINFDFFSATFNQYTFEFLVRIPHFIIPLILLKHKKDIII